MNFITPEAFEAAKERLRDQSGVDEYRLLHNMLSSQPMCFNLFAPLAADLALASRVFGLLLPSEIEAVTRVAFEFAPEPPSEYLNDRTAFDCFVEYVRPDGRRAFVGIETKLTEPFSQKLYDGAAYRRWAERPDSPWPQASWPRLAEVAHNQLWRDHLLAIAMTARPASPYASGKLMLVRHPDDGACATVTKGYEGFLAPGDMTFLDCPLDRVVAACAAACPGAGWVTEFRRRYLELAASESDWQRAHR